MIVSADVIRKSIEHYGKETQSTVCMEEMAELIQAISKEKRGKHDYAHLAEEIADVLICISMLQVMYNVRDCDIQHWIEYKEERIVKRIRESET